MEVIAEYRARLDATCPSFSNFQITGSGKYLGFIVGPDAGPSQWKAPIQKYCQRCDVIAKSGAPVVVSLLYRDQRALSVLDYKAQISVPPSSLHMTDMHCINRVIRAPACFLSVSAASHLSAMGMKGAGSAVIRCHAGLRRASCSGQLT